jgi:hypothetical protein
MMTTRSRRPTRTTLSRRLAPLLLLALFLGPAFPVEVRAQQNDTDADAKKKPHEKPYALIFGTVWGPDNHPVYGIKVKVRRASEKKTHWELFSDHNGEFAVRVPAGRQDYVIAADLKGVKSLAGKQLALVQEGHVHIENDERSDIGLHLK